MMTFENAQVGDKIWSQTHGWGRVTEMNTEKEYPVFVRYSANSCQKYTYEGYLYPSSAYPDVYWQEPEVKYPVTQRPEPEIDWDKVPRMTPVQVRDGIHDEWENKDFIWKMPSDCADESFCFFTTNGSLLNSWTQCRIHPDTEIKPEWLKS